MSLPSRVLLLVFLINAFVFGAGGAFVFRAQVIENERLAAERTEDLLYTIRGTIRPDAAVNVAYILQWEHWGTVEDAILVDNKLHRSEGGTIDATGIAINPVGAVRRPADFDYQAALSGVLRAIESGAPVAGVEGGRAVPIRGQRGVWGGLWYRTVFQADRLGLVRRMLPWFLLSTLLLTAGTFFALRRLVLDPVKLLADGARRVRGGDFSVRLDVAQRRDELSDLVRSFNDMTATVGNFNDHLEYEVQEATGKARQAEAAAMTQRRLAAMGELAAGIAHEINNPLGGLRNAVDVLGREDLPLAKRTQYLGLLERGLARIGETVNRLRRFTPREVLFEYVDLGSVVQDSVDLVVHRARRLGVEIEVEAQGAPRVMGARNELGQALLNLLSNALDALEVSAARERGEARITIAYSEKESGVTLQVRDNGPGVSREDLERVADLFFTTKDVGKGTGLGLSLVHNAIALHGGRVRFSSEEGRHFTVDLTFPAKSGDGAAGTPVGGAS